MTEEQKEVFCDKYCKYPYIYNQERLERQCEKCPLNEEGKEDDKH